jgi:hypothetical protein
MRLGCLAILLAVQVGTAQDKKGCQDPPLISRFPGSVITDCKDSADDTFNFALPGAQSEHGSEARRVYDGLPVRRLPYLRGTHGQDLDSAPGQ